MIIFSAGFTDIVAGECDAQRHFELVLHHAGAKHLEGGGWVGGRRRHDGSKILFGALLSPQSGL